MSWDELKFFLLLSSGEVIEAQDKRTKQRWQGNVDVVACEHGVLWMYTKLGERKLIDNEQHSISKPC